jgi:hypothetical protein
MNMFAKFHQNRTNNDHRVNFLEIPSVVPFSS